MTTVQPYPPGTRWHFYNLQHPKAEFTQELVLYWEAYGSTITDNYLPEEITAEELWRRWVDDVADTLHERLPERYAPGEVHIGWYVTTPHVGGTFEGAPHAVEYPAPPRRWENFLSFFSEPTDAESGEPINWLRLPVLDKGWNVKRADKGGFVQEALGWKPAALQDRMDVRRLGGAAGLYVP